MNQESALLFALIFGVLWAMVAEFRIHRLESELSVSNEKVEDVKIEKKNHELSDGELDALIGSNVGGTTKPPTD